MGLNDMLHCVSLIFRKVNRVKAVTVIQCERFYAYMKCSLSTSKYAIETSESFKTMQEKAHAYPDAKKPLRHNVCDCIAKYVSTCVLRFEFDLLPTPEASYHLTKSRLAGGD